MRLSSSIELGEKGNVFYKSLGDVSFFFELLVRHKKNEKVCDPIMRLIGDYMGEFGEQEYLARDAEKTKRDFEMLRDVMVSNISSRLFCKDCLGVFRLFGRIKGIF